MKKGRIDECFEELRREGRAGTVAYITAGDPTLDRTADYVLALERAGVDLVELGVPFSDPLADGPVNQESAERALRAGATPGGVIELVRGLRSRTRMPIILYSYLNPLLSHGGFEDNLRRMGEAGVDGLLVLDLPPEEARPWHRAMDRYGVAPICLVAPTTPPERIRRIIPCARGFVYCLSRAGVTGARGEWSEEAAGVLARTRAETRLPLALGFGISTPEIAAQTARLADAVVVGSALVQRLHEREPRGDEGLEDVMRWMRSITDAVREARRG
ncbi:MAG: tryptophan synthase subunit alpha [Kiritimatiellae bacterium]|nr:tryptophan synthase subunit alpha [Kiritimatiellia bacterium]